MKILLGGVPFGCDNIGDEAILASVVGVFRRICPSAELTVCTGDREGTERKLGVKTAPLYGFDPAFPADRIAEVLPGVDFYVWSGATGLSDYPEMACSLLETVHAAGVRSIVWSVGMNDEFNPAFFTLSGRKRAFADAVRSVCGFDLARRWKERRIRSVRDRIARTLSRCDLVVLRDPRSLDSLRRCGPFPHAVVGADTAILQKQCAWEALPWSESERYAFQAASARMAVCVSQQSRIRELGVFAGWLDSMLEARPGLLVVTLPMNPKTDYRLMRDLRERSRHQDRILPLRFLEPEEVQAAVSRCDLVVSSRLHLLILGLNNLVPGVGIARGSKISDFLSQFGLVTAGTTARLDLPALTAAADQALSSRDEFTRRAQAVRAGLLADLDRATGLLKQTLETPSHRK